MKQDLHTTAGRRKEILDNVRRGNLVSFNWITANKHRASVATAMQASGELTLKPLSGMMYEATINKKGGGK
jgi:hypothetical protein